LTEQMVELPDENIAKGDDSDSTTQLV